MRMRCGDSLESKRDNVNLKKDAKMEEVKQKKAKANGRKNA